MKIQFLFLGVFATFGNFIQGAESGDVRLTIEPIDTAVVRVATSAIARPPQDDLSEVARRTGLTVDRAIRVRDVLGADYEDNVRDLVKTRKCFRKTANCTEAIGNTFLYLSSGSAAIATACSLIFPVATPYVLFVSTAFLGGHVTLIGIAKCSAREEGEREKQLTDLAQHVGFQEIPLQPTITDDAATNTAGRTDARPV